MNLRLRNTLGGAIEPFEPLEPGHVRMYSCGPTVYAPSHVGNFRSFVFADLVRRVLLFAGYRVTWVMNITDVDDKIIRDAAAAGISIEELTEGHTRTFLEDLAALGIPEPDVMPRATAHIADMVRLTETLIERGNAYRTDDGSVFFKIASWPSYGRLARIDPIDCGQASASTTTSTTRTTSAISRSGRPPSPANPAGRRPSARDGPAGTSSARR